LREWGVNWDAISAISGLLSAAGVIATLVYLAHQIRQNTRAIRGSAMRESQALLNEAHSPLLNSPELNARFERGLEDPDALSNVEAAEFDQLLYLVIATFQSLYFQQHASLLDAEVFEQQTRALVGYLIRPGGNRWWRAYAGEFSPRFRAFIETQLAAPPAFVRDWRDGADR